MAKNKNRSGVDKMNKKGSTELIKRNSMAFKVMVRIYAKEEESLTEDKIKEAIDGLVKDFNFGPRESKKFVEELLEAISRRKAWMARQKNNKVEA